MTHPNFFRSPLSVPAGARRTHIYTPRDHGSEFAWFVDRHGSDLNLTSVKCAHIEYLTQPLRGTMMVMTLPVITLPTLILDIGADLEFHNPTDHAIHATLWIGERGDVARECVRLRKLIAENP